MHEGTFVVHKCTDIGILPEMLLNMSQQMKRVVDPNYWTKISGSPNKTGKNRAFRVCCISKKTCDLNVSLETVRRRLRDNVNQVNGLKTPRWAAKLPKWPTAPPM